TGFSTSETVQLTVQHTDGSAALGNGYNPWQVTDGYWTNDGVHEFAAYVNDAGLLQMADTDHTADGNIGTTWYVNPIDSVDQSFKLTATGLLSGATAETT